MPALAQITFQPGQVLLNKYEVIRPLGSGQFGEVYHVANRNLGHEAALKLVRVNDPARHRAHIEAQAQNLCNHDNVVKIHTADVLIGAVLIEMEFIPDGSLGDRLAREFVPVVDSVGYLKHVLYALEHAHARDIIHRDVKPANIMLAGSTAKLSDFGTVIQPSTGVTVVDPDLFYRPHASPEAVNNAAFGPQADVFGAGMTLLRAANNIADLAPYLSDPRWRQRVLDGTFADRIGYEEFVPSRLKSVLKKALHRKPEERYPDAKSFRQALERLSPARRWIRLGDRNWQCAGQDGREERIVYAAGRVHKVEYIVGSRRQRKQCREFGNELEARAYMAKLVGSTTLAGPGESIGQRRR